MYGVFTTILFFSIFSKFHFRMADIDAFFKNRDKKKKSKKTKVLTATDLFKEEENGTSNQNLDQKPVRTAG